MTFDASRVYYSIHYQVSSAQQGVLTTIHMKTAAYILIAILIIFFIAVSLKGGRDAREQPAPAANGTGETTQVPDAPVVTPQTGEATDEPGADTGANGDAVEPAPASAGDEVPAAPEEPASTEVSFTLDSFNYGYDQTELRVQEGDTVTITLTNSEGFHDWVVDEFNAATEKIQAGGTTEVTFIADTAGTYEFYCSVGNHRAQGLPLTGECVSVMVGTDINDRRHF